MTRHAPTRSRDPSAEADGQKLYETDFFTWTTRQAALLRSGRFEFVDHENVAEEIETLGRSEAAALRSSYRLVALHLLKMRFRPERRSRSWTATIVRERGRIEGCLQDNPGLRPRREELFARAYAAARREAAAETGLDIREFPQTSPFSLDEIERHDAWPGGGTD